MTRKQCLDILDLPAGASPDEIIKAYRHLAQVWHPDRFPNNPELQEKAHAKLAEINQAYSTLIEGKATPDPSESSPNNEGSDTGQSPPADSSALYRDAQVRYLGDDPRLKAPSQWGAMFGNSGVLSAVEVSSTGLALVTSNSEGPDDAMWYAASSLVAVQLERTRWVSPSHDLKWSNELEVLSPGQVRLYFRDPEGILKQLVVVNLKFRNDYFAQLFLKRLQSITPLVTWQPPQSMPTSQAFLIFFITLFVLFAVGVGTVAYNRVDVGQRTTTSSAATQIPAVNVPSYAVSKGSFSVWTDPRDPLPRGTYAIVIQVRLPTNITKYRASDLTGTVTGGMDSYKQVIKFPTTYEVPIKDGAVQVKIPVPGVPGPGAAKLVQDTIQIESSLLGEKQTFLIEF